MTTIVNVKKQYLIKNGYKDFEDWARDPNHVYIGREMSFYVKGAKKSKWANPFPVKKYGVDECLKLYKDYILNNAKLLNELHELENKELGCWCKDENNINQINQISCHGDILIELIKTRK
jgi:Domain of unknown function (DUF4326)